MKELHEINKIYENLLDNQLDLDKIMSLPKEEDKKIVMDLYKQMHDAINCEREPFGGFSISGVKIDLIRFNQIYNTLTECGYLITRREKRLNDILKNK